MLNIEASNQ